MGLNPNFPRPPGEGQVEVRRRDPLTEAFYVRNEEDRERVRGYGQAERLGDVSKHEDLFREIRTQPEGFGSGRNTRNRSWIPLDFPGMLGRLMRHYTLGEEFHLRGEAKGEQELGPLEAQVEAQRQVDRISANSELNCLLRRLVESLPILGDGVIRVDLKDLPDEVNAGGALAPSAVFRYVKPHHYLPTLHPVTGDLMKVELAFLFPGIPGSEGPSTRNILLREIHTPGRIEYKVNRWNNSQELGEELSRSEIRDLPDGEALLSLKDRDTGIEEIPLVLFPWQPGPGAIFGESEVLRVAPIMLALENRLSQMDEVLDKHARPKLVVGPGLLDEQGKLAMAEFDVIEVNPDVFEKAVTPSYLTWDMQAAGISSEIEKLEEYLFMTTETSPASFGLERDGSQVESARALRFKAHRTVNKVQDARRELAKGIRAMLRIAQDLELAERKKTRAAGYRPVGIEIRFGDPIVEDQTQEVQDYVMRKQAGLVSAARAIMDLDGLPRIEAEAEVEQIRQDQVDEAAASSASIGDGLGIGGEAAPPAGPILEAAVEVGQEVEEETPEAAV